MNITISYIVLSVLLYVLPLLARIFSPTDSSFLDQVNVMSVLPCSAYIFHALQAFQALVIIYHQAFAMALSKWDHITGT